MTGDAITAVFGLPAVHEDDALRAVRATAEMTERLASLASELESNGSMRFEFRIGVSTGEVVTGREVGLQLRATGEPLHLSAQLAQAASVGDALLDERTRRLVREAAFVEDSGVGSTPGFRLLAVERVAPGYASRLESPMVGRERERRRLHDAFEQAVADRSCQLFTVLGAAGVGKSRLVREFLERHEPRHGAGTWSVPALRRGDHLLARPRSRHGCRRDRRYGVAGAKSAAARRTARG